MISSDINNFIYVGIIIIGTIAMTLSVVQNVKQVSQRQKGLELFFITMFIYVLSDFLAYYTLSNGGNDKAVFALITISDILSVLTIYAWQYLLFAMSGETDKRYYKFLVFFSIIYTVLQEALSVIYGNYENGEIVISSSSVKMTIEGMSIVFGIVFIALGIRSLIKIGSRKEEMKRTVDFVYGISFVIYILWIEYWDFTVWFSTSDEIVDHYVADPVLVIYMVLSIIFCIYFIKQSEVEMIHKEISDEEIIENWVNEHSLSGREKEVLSLIFMGSTNQDIAEKLFISENTVKRHVNSILKKSDAKNRHELIYKMKNI